jgi:hypothetical protein
MADEEKVVYPVRLYDANGEYLGEAESEHDLDGNAALREQNVEHRGKTYRWDTRTSRWMEHAGTIKIGGKLETPEAEAREAEKAEKVPEKK